ncbi:hypothetical protein ASG90_13050 [Nocardioides sp. Soil797]|nr:hypothetical protein ASG90_13050 [Nocardioides sp. Soil797]
MVIGYPLWWVLGLAPFACIGAAIVMACELGRQPRVSVPRGFWLWGLFLVWVVAGVFLLQVHAPNTEPSPSNTRYVTWLFRLGWYLSATTVMAYVLTMRRQLSTQILMQRVGWLFVTVTAGGFLGTFWPTLEFKSVLELVLPHGVATVPYVRDLVHPTVAQLYTEGGELNPRPSAPFPYTNDWGINYACLLPIFAVSWLNRSAGWHRLAAPVVLVASLVPVIQSQNRGLWLALTLMALFVLVRTLVHGGLIKAMPIVATIAVVLGVLFLTPLKGVIVDRLTGEAGSNDGRVSLGAMSIETVVDRAPLTGLGTTRNVQGSFTSIAVGSSDFCPLCSPPALGTQGQLWLVTFSQGLLGFAFYAGFLLFHFLSRLRHPSAKTTAALCVLIGHFATMPFYNAIGPALLMIGLAVAVLASEREEALSPDHPPVDSVSSLNHQRLVIQANTRLLLLAVALGAFGGCLWQRAEPPTFAAESRVLVPPEQEYAIRGANNETMDTIAQLAYSEDVTDAVRHAAGRASADSRQVLSVAAIPNTRILVLRVTAHSAADARSGVDAAADELIEARSRMLDARRRRAVQELKVRTRAAAKGLGQITHAMSQPNVSASPTLVLDHARTQLAYDAGESNDDFVGAVAADTDAGTVIRASEARRLTDDWNLSVTTGGLLGLLAGLALVVLRGGVPLRFEAPRLRHRGLSRHRTVSAQS